MNKEINYSTKYNCYFLTMRGIISRIINDLTLLWSQSALIYYEDSKGIVFSPYYANISDHLEALYNITERRVSFQNYSDFRNSLEKTINKGYSILLFCDVYDLPYNLYYKKKHNDHAIEITDIRGSNYKVIDHYYKYEGELKDKDLKPALKNMILRGVSKSYTFRYYETSKSIKPDIFKSLSESILINKKIINGINPFSQENNKDIVLGTDALERFVEFIHHEVFLIGKNVDNSFHSLKEYSNARFNFSEMLIKYYYLIPGIETIGYECRKVSNSILVVANMILKSFISQKASQYENRIMTKLSQIIEQEKVISKMLQNIEIPNN